MSAIISVRVEDLGGLPAAHLDGEIDISNASEIRNQLLAALSNTAPGIIVDLSGVTYLDSRGVHVLLELAERVRVRQQRLCIVVPDTALIKRILKLTHLDEIVPLDNTLEDAVARLRSPR